jgi:hypothetical protein
LPCFHRAANTARMAKSMRSKSQRRLRAIKRSSVFGQVEENRLRRLAARQATITPVDGSTMPVAMEETESSMGDASMQVDKSDSVSLRRQKKLKLQQKNRRRRGRTGTIFG